MFKKSICLFLSCAMTIGLFVGCNNDKKTPTSAPSVSSSASQSEEPKEPVKLISIRMNFGQELKTDLEKEVHQIMMDKTGVDLQMVFIASDVYEQKYNLMLASKEQVDLIPTLNIVKLSQLYSDGAIVDIKNSLEKVTEWKDRINPEIWPFVTATDGAVIAWPSEVGSTVPMVLQIREDWLKTLNMSTPKTIEEFEQVMDAFMNGDPDKNNMKDTFALQVICRFNDLRQMDNVFAGLFMTNGYQWFINAEGNLVPPELDPQYKLYLQKMQDWYKKGYIHPEAYTAPLEQKKELVAQNKIGATVGWYSWYIDKGLDILQNTVKEARYLPAALTGTGMNKQPQISALNNGTAVTSMCKDPDAAIRLFNYMSTEEGRLLITHGIEGKSYDVLKAQAGKWVISEPKIYGSKYVLWDTHYKFNVFNMKSWLHEQYALLTPLTKALPSFYPIDSKVAYDVSKFKSSTLIGDLDTYMVEQKMKILMDKASVDEWDKIMATWLEIGGKTLIEDKTAGFKAATK